MNTLNEQIRRCVQQIGDPLMEHLYHDVTGWTDDEIRTEVLAMVKRDELRMKEDVIDHDWAYRKGRNWKQQS